jgi:hypothetical protein
MNYIIAYFEEFYQLLNEMAPWLLLGFLFAGILHVYMPEKKIRKFMGGSNLRSAFNAALLGIPLPLCSCGVIPTGIAFHKEGASKGSTVSFLISTPQTGVDSILVTYSMLGLPFAIIRPIVAFFSGILGGAITNLLSRNESDSEKQTTANNKNDNKGNKLTSMLQYAFVEFLMDIAKWLIIGLAIAAFISLVLPPDFFTLYLKNEYLSMLIVLLAAIPLYVCATGSVPIAAVLIMKGLSPGAALVFLMAGPATNSATMAVIGKAIDKKTLFVYMFSIIVSAFLFGTLINEFLPREWFLLSAMQGMHEHSLLPDWMEIGSGILLILLIINGYRMRYFKKKKIQSINLSNDKNSKAFDLIVGVTGMTCNHCKANVENNLSNLPGIESVDANPDTNEVLIKGADLDLSKIKSVVESIGYNFTGKK